MFLILGFLEYLELSLFSVLCILPFSLIQRHADPLQLRSVNQGRLARWDGEVSEQEDQRPYWKQVWIRTSKERTVQLLSMEAVRTQTDEHLVIITGEIGGSPNTFFNDVAIYMRKQFTMLMARGRSRAYLNCKTHIQMEFDKPTNGSSKSQTTYALIRHGWLMPQLSTNVQNTYLNLLLHLFLD